MVRIGNFTGHPIEKHFNMITLDDLNYAVLRFIHKVSKKDYSFYPAETLYSLIICLQTYCHSHGNEYKFFEDLKFAVIHNTLDNRMKELSAQGIVMKKKQAQPITLSEEEKLWSMNILGDNTLETLLNTLIYLLGVHLALQSIQEHKDLKVGAFSQLCVHYNDEAESKYLLYKPTQMKNHQGGICELNKKHKEVQVYENKVNPHCCVVYIFEKYMGLRPSYDPKCSVDLYLRPLLRYANDGSAWYSCQPIGIHTLQNVTSAICAKAGLVGKCMNHGLKATSATRLFCEGVSEQLVCEITGNTSEAVRAYKCKLSSMQKELSDVLYGNQSESLCEKKVAKLTPCTPELEQSIRSPRYEKCQNVPEDPVEKTCKDNQSITMNVMYNKTKEGDRYLVNVYPVINIAGNVPAGYPVIVNVNINIEK